MSAAVLREAAALMRSRAEAATPSPWKPYTTGNWPNSNYVTPESLAGVATQYALVWEATDAEHIASWHPVVALVVADWLDAVADRAESMAETIGSERVAAATVAANITVYTEALAVARAYLGVSL